MNVRARGRCHARVAIDLAAVAALCAWVALAAASHRFARVPIALYLVVMSVAWTSTLTSLRLARDVSPSALVFRVWFWAVVFRVVGMVAQPVLEDDYFRYLWDGWVFSQTGNPYLTIPADHFLDPSVPDALLPVLSGINYPDVPTIYGPVAQWGFRLSHFVAPGQLWPWKLLLVGAELVTLRLLLRVVSPARAVLFAWCPLLIQETAFSAHPEALGVLAMVAATMWSQRGDHIGAAIGFALAAGVKPIGALLAPLALCRRPLTTWAAFGAATVAVWGPFLLDGTFGEWTGLVVFARQWEYNSSLFGVFAALTGQHIGRTLSLLLMAAGYVALMQATRRQEPGRNGLLGLIRGDWAYGGLLLLSPVVNPWYLAWLVPFVVCHPSRVGIASMAAVSLSYLHGLNIGNVSLGLYAHPAWLRPLEYGIIAVAALSSLGSVLPTRRWRRRVPRRVLYASDSTRGTASLNS